MPVINKVLPDVDSKLVDKIADALSVMDKNAEIQREKKGYEDYENYRSCKTGTGFY